MSGRNKNSNSSLSDFARYREGSMKAEERNAFERKLQKDPFAEEAAEGLAMISASDAVGDMEELAENIRGRTGRKRRIIYYRIAAALTALVVISSLFIFVRPEKQNVTISQNISIEEQPKKALSIPEPQKIQAPSAGVTQGKKVIAAQDNSVKELKTAREEKKDIEKVNESDIMADERINKEVQKTELEPEPGPERAAAAAEINSGRKAATSQASQVSIKENNKIPENYIAPVPVNGRESFVSYLEDNLRHPEPGNTAQQSVILRFLVKKDSTISGIRILETPGERYTNEAIRLIRKGPVWIPALRNNTVIEDSATVNIVFR